MVYAVVVLMAWPLGSLDWYHAWVLFIVLASRFQGNREGRGNRENITPSCCEQHSVIFLEYCLNNCANCLIILRFSSGLLHCQQFHVRIIQGEIRQCLNLR